MSPFLNKGVLAGLASLLLLSACSSTSTRTRQSTDSGTGTQQAAPVKLPRSYDKALVLMQSEDYQAAIPLLQAFIEKNPQHAGPYINLGIAYQNAGQADAALTALNKAIDLNPANAAAYQQLGILYREQGKFDAALDAYSTALKLDTGYALAHRNVGILYDLYLQQPTLALDHYRKYLELSGSDDQTVNRWVVDLERRSGSTQARAAQ